MSSNLTSIITHAEEIIRLAKESQSSSSSSSSTPPSSSSSSSSSSSNPPSSSSSSQSQSSSSAVTLQAILRGREGDFTAGNKLEPDGKLDVRISVLGLTKTIKSVVIRDNTNAGAIWNTPPAATWLIAVRDGVESTTKELYFSFWKEYPSYIVDITFTDNSTAKLTTVAGSSSSSSQSSSVSSSSSSLSSSSNSSSSQSSSSATTTNAQWFAMPLASPTPTNPSHPLRIELQNTWNNKTIKNTWVYQLPSRNSWHIWPTSANSGTILIEKPTSNSLRLWLSDREPGVPMIKIGVEILYTDDTSQKWEIIWAGEGASTWPMMGNGSIRCPVVSIMQHPNTPTVTTQFAHLARGIFPDRPELDFLQVVVDTGHIKEVAPDGLKLRYLVNKLPVSPWIDARNPQYTIPITDPNIEALPNGQYPLSFELDGPGKYMFVPHIAQMMLARVGYAESKNRVIFDSWMTSQDPTNIPPLPGYAIVNEDDAKHIGRPIPAKGRVYAKWGATKPPTDLFVESIIPVDTLFKSGLGMKWDRRVPVDGKPSFYFAAWPPKHGESVLDMNPTWIKSNAEPWHYTFPSKSGYYGPDAWLSNYSQFAGIPGDGWISCDTSGNVCHIARDGKITILVGWEVKEDKQPIWPFAGKEVAKIRENMVLRGSGPALPALGFGTLVDVAINPKNKNECIVTDVVNHCVFKITYDLNNIAARGVVTLVTGTPGVPGNKDGNALVAQYRVPFSACYSPDGENIAISDQENDRIAVLNVATNNVTTFRATPAMRAKYSKNTPPWEIRAAEALTGVDFVIYDPMYIRWNRKNEIVFADRGTSTVRAVNFTTKVARTIINDGNYAMEKGGWMAFDLDHQGNGNDIYLTTFTGSMIDDSSGTRVYRTLNESYQYIPDDGSNKQYPVFRYQVDNDWHFASTVGRGAVRHVIGPHYGWSLFIHPDGAIIANGAGTTGTMILTPPNGRIHPAYDKISFDLYRKGVINRLTPPIFTFGTGGCLIPSNYDQAYIASRYADWGKMTTAEQALLMGTIDFMFGKGLYA